MSASRCKEIVAEVAGIQRGRLKKVIGFRPGLACSRWCGSRGRLWKVLDFRARRERAEELRVGQAPVLGKDGLLEASGEPRRIVSCCIVALCVKAWR